MSKKKTHKEFVKELKDKNFKVYNDFEIISKYQSTHEKIYLLGKYGVVSVDACKLLSGRYPNICSAIDKTDYFIKKAKEVHGDKYIYDRTKYKNSKEKVVIKCKIHGYFKQTPSNHLKGSQCGECGKVNRANTNSKTTNQFIKEAKSIHGDKYKYNLVDYNNNTDLIKIICPIHGVFEQQPNNHLNGSGCVECARMKYSRKCVQIEDERLDKTFGYLYIVKMFSDNEEFYKIGITKTKVNRRFSKLQVYDYKIVAQIKDKLKHIIVLENYLHEKLSQYSYEPNIKFKGYTECFRAIDDNIIEFCYVTLPQRLEKVEKEVLI